jgi:hypothetical protein
MFTVLINVGETSSCHVSLSNGLNFLHAVLGTLLVKNSKELVDDLYHFIVEFCNNIVKFADVTKEYADLVLIRLEFKFLLYIISFESNYKFNRLWILEAKWQEHHSFSQFPISCYSQGGNLHGSRRWSYISWMRAKRSRL